MIAITTNSNEIFLTAKSIFGNFEILNKMNLTKSHYEIVKTFFPNFNDEIEYLNFDVFPCFENNFKLTGIGKTIKINYNQSFNKVKINVNNDDINAYTLIFNDFLKLFNKNIPYGIFYIYEINQVLYLIATTYDNKIVILNKSNNLETLFNKKIVGKNIFNFQPLSEQGIKYIYYNNEITGVVHGIGKI